MCVVLADIMQSGSGYKVLTTGLLRVELAPEEYQLYSEGCGCVEEDRTEEEHEDRRHTTGATVCCCGGNIAETLFDKHLEDLRLLNWSLSHKDRCHHK